MKSDIIYKKDAIEVVCDNCPISFKDKCEWRDNGHCSMNVALEKLSSADVVSREEYEKQERVIEGLHAIIDNYKKNFIRLNDAYMEQINAAQGVGRYEKAMQKLQEMPKYLNGVKAKQIKKIPSDAVQGEWIPDRTFGRSIWVCSVCDNGIYVPCDAFTQKPMYDYCPNCGAKMFREDGEVE